MKKVYKDKIVNIDKTDKFDNKFLFEKISWEEQNQNQDIDIIFMSDLLEKRKNSDILDKVRTKPAMRANVYRAEDEFEIFTSLFENAIKTNKKVHIVWITLETEIDILENYYKNLWFFDEEINAFRIDFSKVIVSASVKIENIMYRWSDYKRLWEAIFFNPPIRESWQVKGLYKWINRWVVAGLYIQTIDEKITDFLTEQISSENIPVIILAKILAYNLEEIWIIGHKKDLIISY